MKKSIIKVTVALGLILGGLIPFSYVVDIDPVAEACGSKDKSADEGSTKDQNPEST
ncbi:MAG: hypothetical protein ACR2NC_02635 [Thermodesulfobacteriota bacterium]